MTIHKSQGSEYPAVVIPLLTGPRMLMNRNLLYTAVTRARSCVTLVGSKDTFSMMIANVQGADPVQRPGGADPGGVAREIIDFPGLLFPRQLSHLPRDCGGSGRTGL